MPPPSVQLSESIERMPYKFGANSSKVSSAKSPKMKSDPLFPYNLSGIIKIKNVKTMLGKYAIQLRMVVERGPEGDVGSNGKELRCGL